MVDAILGLDFLSTHEAKIDLKDHLISLGGIFYELPAGQTFLHAEDKRIIDKTRILTMPSNITKQTPKQRLESQITAFKLDNPLLGTFPNIEHEIILTSNSTFSSRPFQIPLAKKEATEIEIERLLNLGVIQESFSPYSSPAFPIYKKSGAIRLVVDYRRLNSITQRMNYPIPKIQDLLRDLEGSKYFSVIDLSMGYYQIPLREDCQELTSFVFGDRQFCYTRMPFGLSNAPMTFKRPYDFQTPL